VTAFAWLSSALNSLPRKKKGGRKGEDGVMEEGFVLREGGVIPFVSFTIAALYGHIVTGSGERKGKGERGKGGGDEEEGGDDVWIC